MAIRLPANKDYAFFYHFLRSYVVILFVPLIVGSLIYMEISSSIKEETFEKNKIILEQTGSVVERYVEQIEKNVQILSMNPNLDNIAINAIYNSNEVYYDKWKIIEQLKLYKVIMNNYVKGFIVYPKDCDFVITEMSSYDVEAFYLNHFKYSGMDAPTWDRYLKSEFFEGDFLPEGEVEFHLQKFHAIPYIKTIPVARSDSSNGIIVALIDSSFIKNMLINIDIGSEGWLDVADNEGNMIISVRGNSYSDIYEMNEIPGTNEYLINGKRMIVTKVVSPLINWEYTVFVPSGYALENANRTRNLIYIFLSASILIGLIFASRFSYMNQKPLREILSSIRKLNKKQKEEKQNLDYVKDSFRDLVEDNNLLQRKINEQIPVIKAAYLDKLLKGFYGTDEKMEAVFSQEEFNVKGKLFNVAVIKMLWIEESMYHMNIIRATINSLIARISENGIHSHYIDEDKIALIFCFEDDKPETCKIEVESYLRQIYDFVKKEFATEMVIGIGKFNKDISGVSKSFEEALQVLDGFNIGKSIIWFESTKSSNVYYYNLNVETKLYYLVKQNDTLQVNNILKDLYYKNFFEKKLSTEMSWLFIEELIATLIKIGAGEIEDEYIDELLSYSKNRISVDLAYEKIIYMYELCCEKLNRNKADKEKQLIVNIVEFVDNNFTDPGMSLSFVADKFGISEPYLSVKFKEAVEDTFSGYVEKRRIQSACEILDSDLGMLINEIPFKVGYTNDSTFRRAFKRVTGINPKEYKK